MVSFKPLERILLVDDDHTTNHVNQRVLLGGGITRQVDVRLNGRDALTYLTTPDADGHYAAPEIILLDLKMPIMDGFVFLDQYRDLPAAQKARTLFILSSAAGYYDRERLKTYPDVAVMLDKPLEPTYMKQLMREHLPDAFNEKA